MIRYEKRAVDTGDNRANAYDFLQEGNGQPSGRVNGIAGSGIERHTGV
jgi:hypothetical protein